MVENEDMTCIGVFAKSESYFDSYEPDNRYLPSYPAIKNETEIIDK